MTLLFDLQLSKARQGFAKGPVKAVNAALYGYWHEGLPYLPSLDAVRECLPHYYRRAFDRAGGFWFDKHSNDALGYVTLRDTRGKYLNTVYATARDFKP